MTRCLVSGCDRLMDQSFCEASKNVIAKLRHGLMTKFKNIERSPTMTVCTFLEPRYKQAFFTDQSELINTRRRVQEQLVDLIAMDIRDAASSAQSLVPAASRRYDEYSPWSFLECIVSQKQTVGTPMSKAIKEIDLNEDMLPVFF
ncbi:hypothetical protein O0L34_g9238 [Tuta absoluta]|nr:hypothetical protein O0L34_g9238 [Tuta absoluta]